MTVIDWVTLAGILILAQVVGALLDRRRGDGIERRLRAAKAMAWDAGWEAARGDLAAEPVNPYRHHYEEQSVTDPETGFVHTRRVRVRDQP